MNIVDLLVTIVVVTILVTIVLAVVTYVAYKLRLSREPERAEEVGAPRYFVAYPPPGAVAATEGAEDHGAEDPTAQESHAAEA